MPPLDCGGIVRVEEAIDKEVAMKKNLICFPGGKEAAQ